MTPEEKLTEYLEKNGCDAFYVARPENVRYVSRYESDGAALLVTRRNKYLVTDARYTEQAARDCPDYRIVDWRTGGGSMTGAVGGLANADGLESVAFEEDFVTFSEYRELKKAVKAELVPVRGIVETFRMAKTPEEIECSRAACEIASRAFERILSDIKVGVTEKELASRLSHYMVLEGSDTQPYGNILISGARTSLLHGIPSAKAVEYGDFVLMDYGCQYRGYLSDMTRTVVVGRADAKQREVYELERRMESAGIAAMKPGVTGAEVYAATARVLEGTPYLPYHYTGIGHNVGLFVHEQPFMGPRCSAVLQPGYSMTIEPGIYIPGWGGVRIEDQLLITEDGNELLTTARRDLIEL